MGVPTQPFEVVEHTFASARFLEPDAFALEYLVGGNDERARVARRDFIGFRPRQLAGRSFDIGTPVPHARSDHRFIQIRRIPFERYAGFAENARARAACRRQDDGSTLPDQAAASRWRFSICTIVAAVSSTDLRVTSMMGQPWFE